MRRRASELYQVDFVAALFGGFLLVWLSNIGEAEFASRGDGKALTVFEVSAVAHFPGAPAIAWSAAPATSFRSGCAHPRLVAKLRDAGLPASECQNGSTVELKPGEGVGSLHLLAEERARGVGSPQDKVTDSAFVPDFDIAFSSDDDLGVTFGAAFNSATGAPKVTQIGIRPNEAPSNTPSKLLVKGWEHRSFVMMLANDDPATVAIPPAVDFYYMQDGDDVGFGGSTSMSSMVVTVNVVADGAATCSRAEIASSELEADFQPC